MFVMLEIRREPAREMNTEEPFWRKNLEARIAQRGEGGGHGGVPSTVVGHPGSEIRKGVPVYGRRSWRKCTYNRGKHNRSDGTNGNGEGGKDRPRIHTNR